MAIHPLSKGKVVFLGCINHTPINTTLPPHSLSLSIFTPYHLHLLTDLGIGGSKAGAPGLPSDAVHSLIDKLWELENNSCI